MRPLSDHETELVSGGQIGDIIVWGRRFSSALFSYAEQGSGSEPNPYLSSEPGGGGEYDPYAAAAAIDCAKDTTALELAEKIKTLSIPLEQGALLFKQADGHIAYGPRGIGTTGDVVMSLPGGIGYANVMGTMHTHQPTGDVAADFLSFNIDRYPSGDDWNAFASLAIDVAAAGGDITALSMYIIDQAGVVREYTLADRATYDLPPEQLRGWAGDPTPPAPPPPVSPACSQ
jgi:hypothetical protein